MLRITGKAVDRASSSLPPSFSSSTAHNSGPLNKNIVIGESLQRASPLWTFQCSKLLPGSQEGGLLCTCGYQGEKDAASCLQKLPEAWRSVQQRRRVWQAFREEQRKRSVLPQPWTKLLSVEKSFERGVGLDLASSIKPRFLVASKAFHSWPLLIS